MCVEANSLIAAVRKMHDLELQLKSGQVLDLATEARNGAPSCFVVFEGLEVEIAAVQLPDSRFPSCS